MLITDQIQHMFEEPTKPADTTGGQPLRESAGERERQPLAPGQVYNLRAALAFSDAPSLTPRPVSDRPTTKLLERLARARPHVTLTEGAAAAAAPPRARRPQITPPRPDALGSGADAPVARRTVKPRTTRRKRRDASRRVHFPANTPCRRWVAESVSGRSSSEPRW